MNEPVGLHLEPVAEPRRCFGDAHVWRSRRSWTKPLSPDAPGPSGRIYRRLSRVLSTLHELERLEVLFTACPREGPRVTLVVEGGGLSPESAVAASDALADDLLPALAGWREHPPPAQPGNHQLWLQPPCQMSYADTESLADQLRTPDVPFQLAIRWRRVAEDLQFQRELDELVWRAASSPEHLHRVQVLRDLLRVPTPVLATVALRTARWPGRHLRSIVAEAVAGCVVGYDEWGPEPVRFGFDLESRSRVLGLAAVEGPEVSAKAGRRNPANSTAEGQRPHGS